RTGAVRSSAWICDLTSTQRTTTRSGGSRYKPTTSRTLVDELRVARQLPRLAPMRLQPERAPDPCDRTLRQPELGGQRTRRPVRRVLGRRLQRAHDHLLHLGVVDRPRPPRPRLVDETVETIGRKPRTPPRDHPPRDREPLGNLRVAEPRSGRKHDPRPLRQRLRALAPPRPCLQLLP